MSLFISHETASRRANTLRLAASSWHLVSPTPLWFCKASALRLAASPCHPSSASHFRLIILMNSKRKAQ